MNDLFPLLSLEEVFGSILDVSPLVVRFQGARSTSPSIDPCDVELYGPGAHIVPGSLTRWFDHPADIHALLTIPATRPNMVRFQVVFEGGLPTSSLIDAVLDIAILAAPGS